MAEDVGSGYVNEVRREGRQVAPYLGRKAAREPIFSAFARKWYGGHIHKVARRWKRRLRDRRRVDPHRYTATEQMADQQVQRLVRTVPRVIIVAAEKCDAKVRRLHDRGDLTPECGEHWAGRRSTLCRGVDVALACQSPYPRFAAELGPLTNGLAEFIALFVNGRDNRTHGDAQIYQHGL